MNNKRGKVLAVSAIAFTVVFLFVAGIIRENAREEAIPVIGTVYFGGDAPAGESRASFVGETIKGRGGSQNDTTVNIISEKSTIININTATRDELMELPGVGEVTADRIIEYRETKPFASTDELIEIKGIGEAKLEKILPFVTV
jgi:competence ComEA-like helix-hairpin-helix protein